MARLKSVFLKASFFSRWTLPAIAVVCLMPLAVALYLRFVAPPELPPFAGKTLTPSVFPYSYVQQLNGQPMAFADVGDHWLLVHVESGKCGMACRDALYLTRQARTAQGRNMERVQRIWIISDAATPAASLLAANPDLLLLRATDKRLFQQLSPEPPSMSPVIYLVDRRGFLVFRYEATVTPEVFIHELGRLVRF